MRAEDFVGRRGPGSLAHAIGTWDNVARVVVPVDD